METQKGGAPPILLAGKLGKAPVMRNEAKRTLPRDGNDTSPKQDDKTCPVSRQRLSALEDANVVRLDRARVRAALSKGNLDFDEFLDDTPASCLKVSIFQVLTWLPYIAAPKARQILALVRQLVPQDVSGDTRMGELDNRTKYALCDMASKHGRPGKMPRLLVESFA